MFETPSYVVVDMVRNNVISVGALVERFHL